MHLNPSGHIDNNCSDGRSDHGKVSSLYGDQIMTCVCKILLVLTCLSAKTYVTSVHDQTMF